MTYRILVLNDLHCGSDVGLRLEPENEIQELLLTCFDEVCEWGADPDLLICNGDAVDGNDPKGRTAQNDDIGWQTKEAERCLLRVNPKKVRLTYGSSYHVGDVVPYERFLSNQLQSRGIDCDIRPVVKVSINTWWTGFFKHAAPRSVVPYGRHTGPSRGRVWSAIKEARKRRGQQPGALPHGWIYAHTHYYTESADLLGRTVTAPGWKAVGGKDLYGQKNFEDAVDIGAIQILIGESEAEGWDIKHLAWPGDLVDELETL